MKQIKNVVLAVLGGLLVLSGTITSCKPKHDSSGALITGVAPNPAITGTNFTGTATVSINGGTAIAATGGLIATINGTQVPYTGGVFTVNAASQVQHPIQLLLQI